MKIQKNLPLLLWDGDCRVCAKWVDRWQKKTKSKIQYVPYQSFETDEKDRLKDYPKISIEACKQAVQLLMPDGMHFTAAEAVFRALDSAETQKAWLWFYRYAPGFRFVSELIYRFVASHRKWF